MKIKNLFFALLLLLGTSGIGMASNDDAGTSKMVKGKEKSQLAASELHGALSDMLEYPDVLDGMKSARAFVQFRVTKDLKLRVIQVSGEHGDLNAHVGEELEGLDLKQFKALRGRRVQVWLSFTPY